MYHISCCFSEQTYSLKDNNLQYLGSSNTELDLAFFQVIEAGKGDSCEIDEKEVKGFNLNVDFDIYQGQPIILAGFPIALASLEGKLEKTPKIQGGRVAAAGSYHDIAFGDISGSLPNTSGGAIISTIDIGNGLLGVHMGAVWHEDWIIK